MEFLWENFVIQIVSFLILYWLLSKYAFGPLMSLMQKRRDHVIGELKNAETSRLDAEKLFAEQKEALNQARKDAFDIIEQARVTSSRQADEMITKARNETVRLKDDAVKDIEIEKNKAIAALRSQVSAMSVMIASKIIEKQVDEKSQEQLIEHYLKEVGGKS
jgi:F-type H+-transporting ATPase subunit b